MEQASTWKSTRIILRAGACFFLLFSAATQTTYAEDYLAPDFSHDVGLSPEFIALHISQLRTSSGPSHYRMRYYEFDVDEVAHQKIADLFAKQRVHSWAPASPAGRMIDTLQRVHSWDPDSPASRMIDTLVGIGRPNVSYSWVWTDVFPPFRQWFVACYPENDPDYGFRWLEIQPSRAGVRKALLAAGNRVPVLNAAELSDCAAIKLTELAEFYSPLSTSSPLPYPFARRSFREMLRTKFEPQSLNYFGFIFVDSKHWFRFSASKTEFEKIMRGLDMAPVRTHQVLYLLDDTTQPEWWRIQASAIQWVRCARFPLETPKPGEAAIEHQRLPLHIHAAWQSGFGYVVMASGASSEFATDSCQ